MAGTKRAQSMATWTTPLCPFAIDYIQQVLDDMRTAVVTAFRAFAHGGLEIGGILVGRRSEGRICITEYRPISCEHAFGPTFQLSAADHERLAAAIAALQGTGQTVVGWFHSHTRTGIVLSEGDLDIYNRHFPEPWQVALVMKPTPQEPTLCGFFFREEDGSIHSTESYKEFLLGGQTAPDLVVVEELSSPAPAEPATNGFSTPNSNRKPRERPELPQSVRDDSAAPPAIISAPRRGATAAAPVAELAKRWDSPDALPVRRELPRAQVHWPRALVGGLIIVTLVGAYAFLGRTETRVQPSRAAATDQPGGMPAAGEQKEAGSTLGLRLQRQGLDLAVTWNRDLPEALGATAGLLTIKDGAKRQEMGLTVEQLHSPNILIAPVSDQIEVQLVVLLPNERIMRESGIVILPGQRSHALKRPEQAAVAALPLTPAARVPAAPAPAVSNATVPWTSFTGTNVKPKPTEVKAAKVFLVPPSRTPPPEVRLNDEPPPLKGIGPAERTRPIPLASLRTFTVIPPPPSSSPAGGVQGAADAGIGKLTHPAEVLSRKEPIYPYEARTRHIGGIVVLEGRVGTDGHVRNLNVISGLKVLQQAALDAVSQWVYKPATLNGTNVESTMRVEVQFR